MKTYTSVAFILLFCCQIAAAQTNDIKAQSAYLQAYEAFGKSNFNEAVNSLQNARELLGKTNSKIQYLLVKSLIEAKDHVKADVELKKYFEVTPESARDERYEEMVKSVVLVERVRMEHDKRVAEQKAAVEANNKRQEQLLVNEINLVESQIKQNRKKIAGKLTKGILALGGAAGGYLLIAKNAKEYATDEEDTRAAIGAVGGTFMFIGSLLSFSNAGGLGKENRRLKDQLNQLRSINKVTVLPSYNPALGSVGLYARLKF